MAEFAFVSSTLHNPNMLLNHQAKQNEHHIMNVECVTFEGRVAWEVSSAIPKEEEVLPTTLTSNANSNQTSTMKRSPKSSKSSSKYSKPKSQNLPDPVEAENTAPTGLTWLDCLLNLLILLVIIISAFRGAMICYEMFHSQADLVMSDSTNVGLPRYVCGVCIQT